MSSRGSAAAFFLPYTPLLRGFGFINTRILGVVFTPNEITEEVANKMIMVKLQSEGRKGLKEFVQNGEQRNSQPQNDQVQQPEPAPQPMAAPKI